MLDWPPSRWNRWRNRRKTENHLSVEAGMKAAAIAPVAFHAWRAARRRACPPGVSDADGRRGEEGGREGAEQRRTSAKAATS